MEILHDLITAHCDHEPGSADCQSAVSRIGNPRPLPTASRRNSRLPTCATSRFMESHNLRDRTRIGSMNLPSEFVLVPRPRPRSFWAGTDSRTSRGHLAEERFMESHPFLSELQYRTAKRC